MNKYLIIILLSSINFFSFAQTSEDSLKIENLNKEYNTTDTFTFSFKNESSKKLYISISLEKKANLKWKLCLLDIFQEEGIYMVDNILYLNSFEERKENWILKKIMCKNKNIFRFRFHIGIKPNDLKISKFSTIFFLYP